MDRDKALQTVERLLKQGKVQVALAEFERLSRDAPEDLLTLNRLGDLLARQGRPSEAIRYYGKIAENFAQGGFLSKAVAIHKKILRVDQHNLDSLVQIGELYALQKLPSEARTFFLHAAELALKRSEYAQARQVYERLVATDPDDPRHRVRLAETLAAEGHGEQAGEELLKTGRSLLDAGRPAEAEKIFHRASELLPQRSEPLLGVAGSLIELGRAAEAIDTLERAASGPSADPGLVAELALSYEMAGRSDDALGLLERAPCTKLPPATVRRIFERYLERGQADQIWERLSSILAQALRSDSRSLVRLLDELADMEEPGHIPALQRLFEAHKHLGDRVQTTRSLERLVRAYHACSMHDEASLMQDELRALAPDSPLAAAAMADEPPLAADEPPDAAVAEEEASPSLSAQPPLSAEAPAVPLNRTDEEFVAGRLTQAEILEKYGLKEQALQQLQEIVEKFPGHVEALERVVWMLRSGGGKRELGEALVRLALGLRAGGDAAGGKTAAEEALGLGTMTPQSRRMLEQLGLVAPPESAVTAAPAPVRQPGAAEDEIVIDLDDLDVAKPRAPAASTEMLPLSAEPSGHAVDPVADSSPAPRQPQPSPAASRRPTRAPSADMLEEIRFYIDQRMLEDAQRRVTALQALGYASAELDLLAADLAGAPGPLTEPEIQAPAPAESVEPGLAEQLVPAELLDAAVLLDDVDDDLSAITAALEGELFADDQPLVPEEASEQSLDEIFAAFKQHVQQQVGSDDFRTHYDLGIAYKEMGLTEEAISEFTIVTRSEDMYRDACSMIAICHCERREMPQAARWYRQAIAAPGGDAESQCRLRYDLAEVLLQAGEAEQALTLFRDLLQADPSFRDVRDRVIQLESQLQA